MDAVKPFSYLTGEIRPPPKSGFRKPDEIYGTALHANTVPRPMGYPTLSKDGDNPTKRLSPDTQNEAVFHRDASNAYQPIEATPHLQMYQTMDTEHESKEQEPPNGLQKQLKKRNPEGEIKTVPTVAPKRTHDQMEPTAEKDHQGAFTSREHFYGGRQGNGQTDRSKGSSLDDSIDSEHLYGQVNRHREIGRKEEESINSYETPYPNLYTEAMKSIPSNVENQPFYSIDEGRKPDFGDVIDDFSDLCPSSPVADNRNLFDNFILVGPSRTDSRTDAVTSNGPTKRLKLQELFDPPPPSMLSPRKVSILGVTNTESSDYLTGALDYKPKGPLYGDNNNSRVKGPVSTFDNPDYNVSTSYIQVGGNALEFPDRRSGSSESLEVSNTTDRLGQTPEVLARRRRCDKRLCTAILITALVTSVICLGAGFIAGWFGREHRGF